MKSKMLQGWGVSERALQFLIITLLLLGICFRFVNLDGKIYGDDETITSLRVSGYTIAEMSQDVFNGRVVSSKYLQKYQRINPEKGLIDTINSLATEDSPHTPLYYVMTRFWVQLFGDSIAVTRSLGVLISLLVFPSIYWLSLELFESSVVGWVAIALIAVSPFHLLHAQLAREYSLWTVTILLMNAALLRAMRLETQGRDARDRIWAWGMYLIAFALGLYSHVFTGFVAMAHGIYVVVTEGFRLSKTLICYLFASIASLLIFSPWILVLINTTDKMHTTTSWLNWETNGWDLVKFWNLTLADFFVDFKIDQLKLYLSFPILILVAYSIYYLCYNTPRRVYFFILIVSGVTALALILPDLIFGGRRSAIGRYLIPCYLGIQLTVAFLLATKISSLSVKPWRHKVWQLVTIVLVSSGVISCTISSQADTWGGSGRLYFRVASIINKATNPLVISNIYDLLPGRHIALSYLLEPKVKLLFVEQPNIPNIQIPNGFSDVFVFEPFPKLREQLEQKENYKLKRIPILNRKKDWLLRAEK
jgi:uncharacterized membrane protein